MRSLGFGPCLHSGSWLGFMLIMSAAGRHITKTCARSSRNVAHTKCDPVSQPCLSGSSVLNSVAKTNDNNSHNNAKMGFQNSGVMFGAMLAISRT